MKEILRTDEAPAAIGPYSQAVRSGALTFLSGQIGLVPETGEMVEGGTQVELDQILKNLDAVLNCADLTKRDVLKLTIYVTDLYDFGMVNSALERYFESEFPARETVEVKALPKGARIEISAIAGK